MPGGRLAQMGERPSISPAPGSIQPADENFPSRRGNQKMPDFDFF